MEDFVSRRFFFWNQNSPSQAGFGGREVEAMVSYAWDLIKKQARVLVGRMQNYNNGRRMGLSDMRILYHTHRIHV